MSVAAGMDPQAPASRGAMGVRRTQAQARSVTPLRPVHGFEATAYAWAGSRLVWAGQGARTDHPRNWHQPWRAPAPAGDAAALRRGAEFALARLAHWPAHGLLAWLAGGAPPFPLALAQARLDAVRDALVANDALAFAATAPRLLGLGPGLTPSGDDLLGGIFFALAHAPRRGWAQPLATLKAGLRRTSRQATNPISAVLLSDLMRGVGYRALHDWLAALEGGEPAAIDHAAAELLQLGASSGADLMCGTLIALASTPDSPPRRTRAAASRTSE